ncbi:MAG TPA: Rne/Rng family ribonuclease [Candidatus Sulfotelmatobacter sp.]|nr:Rne/Rng family ribonuclease [Candidatus Sulfotelmatobacter sp.]
MNKELFVSSTPHETKVGLVEDDLLAEVYLERENEYTLAGSIYKGRVTRVLPGMQSAFVDIGLERDAFLYVSDFMDLEEQDDDLTEAIPASLAVQDLRPQSVPADATPLLEGTATEGTFEADRLQEINGGFLPGESNRSEEGRLPEQTGAAHESGNSGENRDRGSWRGRRRRGRGGRRDGRSDRGADRNNERGGESRFSRSAETSRPDSGRAEFGRNQASQPPAGYTPILLPGESISKYSRLAQRQTVQAPLEHESGPEGDAELPANDETPLAATFPEDEPIFAASETIAEPLHEQHEDSRASAEESTDQPASTLSASTSTDWNSEFRHPEHLEEDIPALGWPGEVRIVAAEEELGSRKRQEADEEQHEEHHQDDQALSIGEYADLKPRQEPTPFYAAPGTVEEETIDEEEVGSLPYETSSDEGYDEFEEETHAGPGQLDSVARDAVAEIHGSSMTEEGAHAAPPAPSEDDSEELELEEAQAEAEAILDAEARANGTVDARVEVRAPTGTAGYTQRAPRPRFERPGYERRGGRRSSGGGRRFRRQSAPVPLISDLLKEGQEILVQIAKEPIGKKGARITSHIALPGRFLVYMPTVNHTGVSRKIASEEERQRLKRIILSERENGHGGFIVRTAAQSASEEELRADIRFLKGLWLDIKNRAESSKPPALIYHDLNVVERVLRDQVTSDFSVIWVDTESEYERILRFFNRFQPALVKRVKLYTKETPLFEQFGLAEEMNKALKSKVWLKSGGYIVINQTEALVAIDINTGKYVGKTQRLEDTIVKTNVDAIKEIVRQIRLRDLGGIIIIDFIDMDERRNRQRVMQALEEELRHDRAPSKTLQFNDFGLVAITRKRVKQSLERTIGAPCPYCQSTGYVKSVTTVCNEIYVEMRKIAKHLEHKDVLLRVNPEVAKELKSNNARLLNEMEELTKRTIIVKSDPALHQEQFDIN